MKIHISSKLTQYLINIFKIRFLMRNCLKYVQQCKNGIFKKTCWETIVPYSDMWISPQYFVNIGSLGNPQIPDAGPFYLPNLKIGM